MVYVGISRVNMCGLTRGSCYGTDAQSIVNLCVPMCSLNISYLLVVIRLRTVTNGCLRPDRMTILSFIGPTVAGAFGNRHHQGRKWATSRTEVVSGVSTGTGGDPGGRLPGGCRGRYFRRLRIYRRAAVR